MTTRTISGLSLILAVWMNAWCHAHHPVEQLIVSSWTGNKVGVYDAVSGTFAENLTGGAISLAHSVRLGPDGLLYVTSFGNDKIVRYDPADELAFIDTFVAIGSGGLDGPTDAQFNAAGNLLVTSYNTNSVIEYNGTTGAPIGDFISSGSGLLAGAEMMQWKPDGNLLVASGQNNRVLEYDGATGAFLGNFVTPASGGLIDPHAMTYGPDGHLYVASFGTDPILRYDGTTGAFMDTFVPAGSGGLDAPHGMAFGIDGNFYVASFATNSVLRFDGFTGDFIDAFLSSGSGGMAGPTHLIFRPRNDLELFFPDPGLPGAMNTFVAQGAAPGEKVIFAYSGGTGGFGIPGCSTTLFLGNAQFLAKATADGGGIASKTLQIPPRATGRRVYLQALVKSSCKRSNVVNFVFP